MTALAALGMTLVLGAATLPAQASPAQEPLELRYAASHLHCARYLEASRSDIQTESGLGAVEATTERDGIWSFHARDTAGGVAIEAWYDSLTLRRRSAGQEVGADTDGLIGGRYRGLLSA